MAKIRITNLRLRAIIGTNGWERKTRQEVVINISFNYDAARAAAGDDLSSAVDYKTMTKNIIREVKASKFLLLEKLAHHILKIVTANPAVRGAVVRVDKPGALRFADSVSVEMTQ
ncbi:MAG: dihydroneopterin aldolase [Candidatus Omnitrophica bacterium]|nr:dihydroneopterin aldolase [Candidatus Omnitrophota bacterium]